MNDEIRFRVLKFGGTSLESAERIQSVAALVAERVAAQPLIVVVSAMAGVTTGLIEAAQRAAREAPFDELLETLIERHRTAGQAVAGDDERTAVLDWLEQQVADLRSLLQGVALVRDCSPRVLDAILVYGELFSATLLAAALRTLHVPAAAVDARRLIVTDPAFGRGVVDRAATNARIRAQAWSRLTVPVVTGFIAATVDGITTTLGRGGSDYTATLIGAALQAEAVEIWTDVDGVMTADPRLVPQAFPLPSMSYTELMELSHFGAKVIYPPSVGPARDAGVALVIRNTQNPQFPGTWVLPGERAAHDRTERQNPVCGVSSIHEVALCRLEGAGMVGVAGIATRLFGALARENISVILISQASSEHSICFAIEPPAALQARFRINAEFELERRAGAVDPLIVEEGLAVVAIVGEGMRETPGVAGRLFDILGRNGINVRAIAQGSSELNISLVLPRTDEERALRLIHDAFFFPRTRFVQVFVAGTGRVGAALLDQIAAQPDRLAERTGVRLSIAGIGRRSNTLIMEGGIPLSDWRTRLSQATGDGTGVIEAALRSPNAHRVFVDCTASPEVAAAYEQLLRQGVAIVSANKIALSASLERYETLRATARQGNGIYSETTVGAGLPVLRPVADLIATGDLIHHVDCVLSGTLSFLFAKVMQGVPFSRAVREAFDLGFTEPDPREDLSGQDVARKLLILGREAGFDIEPEQVNIQPILPMATWSRLSLDEFWRELPSVDHEFETRRKAAEGRGGTLSYLGSIEASGAQVALREIERSHPCAALSPGDNLIAVTSARYSDRPLIIRGPGAGPHVTAAGLFADVLRASVEAR